MTFLEERMQIHWVVEQGTFLMWHGNDKGMGRIEDINTAEVIAETSIRIDNPEEGYFTINQ